ncbi:MAG: nucleotidyltransferase family protein, partial [Clostridia bacterium]
DALCAKTLAFGAESDLAMLKNAAEVIYDKTKIKNYIKTQKNLSFPRAIEAILSQEMGTEYAEAMKKPNNILGVEYICAIQRLESKIVPIAIKRQSEFASASQIRELFLKNTGDFSCIPQKAAEVYKELENDEFPRSIYNMSDVFLYALRTKSKKSLYGIDSGTAKKLHLIARQAKSLYELIYSPLFTEITNARLRRAIISSVFEITADDAKTKPLYALLLAANQNGCAYLKENQNQFKIPVITKPAHMKYYNNGEEKEIFAAFLRAEVADTVAALSAPSKKNAVSGMTFSPYILQ